MSVDSISPASDTRNVGLSTRVAFPRAMHHYCAYLNKRLPLALVQDGQLPQGWTWSQERVQFPYLSCGEDKSFL